MAKIRAEDEIVDELITQAGAEAAKIKTADERIDKAKVAIERLQEAFVEMAVAFERVRLAFIELNESPVLIELAESQELRELDDDPKWDPSPEEHVREGGDDDDDEVVEPNALRVAQVLRRQSGDDDNDSPVAAKRHLDDDVIVSGDCFRA